MNVADGVIATLYAYDSNGNRLSRTKNGSTDTAIYDAQDRLLTYGNATYTYNANGELMTKTDASGTTRYGYDVLGNLRTVNLPDGRAIEYVIDPQNLRVGKKVNGALVRGWLYGDQIRIVAELDGNNAVVSRFVYGSHTSVPDYMVRGGITYRLLTDQVGSPRLVVDTNTGAFAQMLGYDEFGNVLGDTSAGFQPFGFAGGLYDPDTKLVRFGARDYDPQTGRWTAKDPILFGGGDTSLYAYVTGDPINLGDETGLAVLIGKHSAFFPGDPENHAAIVLRPDDPSQFSGQPWFTRTGGQEATLGGQAWGTGSNYTWWPTPFGRLHGVANFPGDNPRNLSNLTPVSCPTGMNDTQFITALINAASRYDNNAPYDPLPSRLGPYYNSNSYAAGVIRAAGGTPPPLANVPGYNKSLPIH